MAEQKIDLKSMYLPEIESFLASWGSPIPAKQIFIWMHRGVESFEEMTNLSKALRGKLAELCTMTALKVERKQVSKLDGTIKVPVAAGGTTTA